MGIPYVIDNKEHTLADVLNKLLKEHSENHWILKPNNSLYWYSQVREWVERYAAPGPR